MMDSIVFRSDFYSGSYFKLQASINEDDHQEM